MPKRVKVASESGSDRNRHFHDNFTGAGVTRADFVRAIERENYPKYHARNVNGVKTPAANPDGNARNNLG